MICPHGHESQAEDFCDTCGAKIDPLRQTSGSEGSSPSRAGAGDGRPGGSAHAGGVGPLAPTAPTPTGQVCPHCATTNLPDALFCEACGYDFTTGALPRGAVPAGGGAEPATTEASPVPVPPVTSAGSAVSPPVSATGTLEWVAEVWVDPDWYAGQEAEEPMPSPGLPTVVPLRLRSNLVGRVSTSRSIHPDIDCTSDTGVSRRHAQLTTDGTRWFVEDLGSANGTYVGPASGPLPVDPVAVGPRTELDADDRIYVGAWTRLVVRRATPEEQAETS